MSDANEQLFSISQLAELTMLDRATVRKYLDGVPHQGGAKNAKTYTLKAALPALVTGRNAEMDEAKLKKAQADATLRELELKREQGEVVELKEVRNYAQALFKGVQQRTAVQMARDVAPQLYKADSPAQITEILQRELGRIFNDLRTDHPSFL
jgi:phage terminase Nu1 subunit (DNA packaging protein)